MSQTTATGEAVTEDSITESNTDTAAALAAGVMLGQFKKNPDEQSPLSAVVLVPAGAQVEGIDRPERPFRRKGIVKLNDVDSFIEYFKRYHVDDHTNVYGNLNPANFTALFNDNKVRSASADLTSADANWRDFGCSYAPKHSKEFTTWDLSNKKKFDGNEEFAVWLEDNLVDVIEPSNGQLLELALNFKVNTNATFANPIRLQDGNTEFNFTNHVDGSSQINGQGKVKIPEYIKIFIPVFDGRNEPCYEFHGRNEPCYEFQARFRYRLSGAKLNIWYELIRPHKVVEEAFNDLVDKIEEETAQTILYGTP
jgi:uncharacterized protein YfdQ (DUF2303 family)